MRLFVAISIPEVIKSHLTAVVKKMKAQQGWPIRWVPHDNYHITLNFLGNTSEETAKAVAETFKQGLADVESFDVTLGKITCLPSPSHPRVLMCAIQPTQALLHLPCLMGEFMALHGFALEKRAYVPHITLGRFKSDQIPSVERFPQSMLGETFEVSEVSLFQSIPVLHGVKYEAFERFALVK